MKCKYADDDEICQKQYKGYKCIEEKCEDYGKYMIDNVSVCNTCKHSRDGYCKKNKRFECRKECLDYEAIS